ncbi:MAG: hypothetical protein GX444_07325 [Myxococcales bacterium]|nr:hypothetical protein [Myxococcales bacterium]
MNRREFLFTSTAMMFSALLANTAGLKGKAFADELDGWMPGDPRRKDGPAPAPEITAVVDIIVPPDPEIPGDFKGSDYGGDWVLAATMGSMGQMMAVLYLNRYAKQTAGKKFIQCTDEEKMAALHQWIAERDDQSYLINQMLSGILTVSMIGTYEVEDPDLSLELFESMNWFDPEDPDGTFHLPCEGYPDAKMFPVRLKKGLRK